MGKNLLLSLALAAVCANAAFAEGDGKPKKLLAEYTQTSGEGYFMFKWAYTYNAQGLRESESRYAVEGWDTPQSRTEYTYNEANKPTLTLGYTWDSDKNELVCDSKAEYTYDANYNLIGFTAYNLIIAENDWRVVQKMVATYYNDTPNLLTEVRYEWDYNQEALIETSKKNNSYNEKGLLSTEESFTWNRYNQKWNGSKNEYEYNDADLVSTREYYVWDAASESWNVSNKAELEYDDRGNLTQQVAFDWNAESEGWKQTVKYEYEYDDMGNCTYYESWVWNESKNGFVPTQKQESEYLANGLCILTVDYKWDIDAESWVGKTKTEREVDGNWITKLYSVWNADADDWRLITKEVQELDDDEYTLKREYYVYSPETDGLVLQYEVSYRWISYEEAGIGSVEANGFDFAVNGRSIDFADPQLVAVYRIDGSMVYSGVAGRVELPSAGMYIVHTSQGASKVLVK